MFQQILKNKGHLSMIRSVCSMYVGSVISQTKLNLNIGLAQVSAILRMESYVTFVCQFIFL